MKNLLLFLFCLCAFASKAQTPADSLGVYAIYGDKITPVELIDYHNTKISMGFMSAKTKLEFDNETSPHHFNGAAKFRIYFGQPSPYQAARLYMFAPNFSIRDFGIGQFEVKKGRRLLTTTKVSVFSGGDIGAQQAEEFTIETLEIRPGVYEVTVIAAPGEYCIMHTFRGSAGYGGVFDFTIE